MRQKAKPSTVKAAVNAQDALKLRISGMGYVAIGQTLGIATSHAYNLVLGELQRLRETSAELAEHVRDIEMQRLDELQAAHWQKALQADPSSTNQVLSIMGRRAKLLGIDAPEKIEMSAPPDTEALMEKLAARLADESDASEESQ